jgi:O-antigen/teichoic acid export membrane protein
VREDQQRPGRAAEKGTGGLTSTSGRLARNTFWSAIGEGSNALLFLLAFIAPRLLGPESFGVYRTAFFFVGLFRILPDFGMSYASTIDISRDRSLAARLIGNLLGFQGVLSVLTLVLCLAVGRAVYRGELWVAVVILSFDLILKSVKSTLRWLLKALEAFGTEAVSLLIERTALLLAGTFVLWRGGGVIGFVGIFFAVRLLDTCGLLAYVRRRQPLVPQHDAATWRELFRKGLPFAYVGLMITLFFQIDALMLEKMRGDLEAGWYGAPVGVLEGLTLVPRIFGYALIPTMAAVYATAPATVTELYRRGSKYLLLAGLPVAAFGVLASDRFIPLIFGPKYLASIPAAQWLLPSAAFMFLSNFGETTLACINRWKSIVWLSTIALVLNVGLNLVCIPRWGYVGAARVTLVTEAAYFLMISVAVARFGHRPRWLSLAGRPILATAMFAAILWVARPLGLIPSSLLASAAFAVATFALGVWDRQETVLMRRGLRLGVPVDQ